MQVIVNLPRELNNRSASELQLIVKDAARQLDGRIRAANDDLGFRQLTVEVDDQDLQMFERKLIRSTRPLNFLTTTGLAPVPVINISPQPV